MSGMTTTQEVKDEALARVEDHATEEEKRRLRDAVHKTAHDYPDGFTADDVWEYLTGWSPREPRLLGAVLRREARGLGLAPQGWIKSERARCHGRPVQVWRRSP